MNKLIGTILFVIVAVAGILVWHPWTQQAPALLASQTPAAPGDPSTSAQSTNKPVDVPSSVGADPTPPIVAEDPQAPAAPPVTDRAVHSRSFNADPRSAGGAARPSKASLDQGPQPIVAEADARIALDSVGMDPDAEAVWMTAMNDPTLPDKARKNLIEDLNENGISDPDHPTIDDLPLIQSRLALIEQLAPGAMDDVNLAAFAEAYKDLTGMAKTLAAH